MNHHPIPSHWSPEQALAVCEYLQQLSELSWAQYRGPLIDRLGPLLEQSLHPASPASPPQHIDRFETPPSDFDDDLPF